MFNIVNFGTMNPEEKIAALRAELLLVQNLSEGDVTALQNKATDKDGIEGAIADLLREREARAQEARAQEALRAQEGVEEGVDGKDDASKTVAKEAGSFPYTSAVYGFSAFMFTASYNMWSTVGAYTSIPYNSLNAFTKANLAASVPSNDESSHEMKPLTAAQKAGNGAKVVARGVSNYIVWPVLALVCNAIRAVATVVGAAGAFAVGFVAGVVGVVPALFEGIASGVLKPVANGVSSGYAWCVNRCSRKNSEMQSLTSASRLKPMEAHTKYEQQQDSVELIPSTPALTWTETLLKGLPNVGSFFKRKA